MGNFCPNGSSSVGHEEISVSTKPLPAVKHGKNPVNQKAPPPVVVMPPARGSNPKFPVAETRTIDNTTRKKQQEKPRSVDDPSREKQHEKKPRSVETPPSNPVEKQGVGKKAVPPSGKIVTPNLKMFTLTDLMTATKNFRPESMIGEGGFGQVFKGWVDEETLSPSRAGVGIPIAVKKSNPDSAQGLHEWQCEVRFLGKFHHPNLVKLLGYCWEENQFLLVYEFLPKGSLENHLFSKGDGLTWDTRLKIAIEAAQGLTFLHNSEKSVIYRDFKASNILLDSNFNAKLSDFGLAKHGPINGYSHVTTRVMGTQGYAAPEYVATGHLYVLSDVYGFGVVLLELLTGLRALDPNRPSAQQNLVEWAKPVLTQKKKIQKLMDPRLENKYPLLAVSKTAALILRCLEADPKNRPPMDDVLRELEIVRTIREQPKEEKRNRNNGHGSPHVRKTGRTR
ncbi:probable serine/threonine-protein kinase PBL11 isoform X2 [Brassica napus]|uniref:probable serine/threonine-protein kinase PBL11 isoform X2 n=1 Tax=Brassica napus TaxID=3708 RepID=UPI0004F1CEF4|nr:probable serine/threonine-protein kinase PBL11 isoform X2 [Brassica napus]